MTTTNLPARRTAAVPAARTTASPMRTTRPPITPLLTTRMFLGLFLIGLAGAFLLGLVLSINTLS